MKVCRTCGQSKPETDFYRWSYANPELRPTCKACEGIRARHYHNTHLEQTLLRSAKHNAKVNGLNFNLTIEDVQIPSVCPVLGIPIESDPNRQRYERPDGIPSLDRIHPALGYVKGNVAVISWKANRLKNNVTASELEAIIAYVEARQ
jgi:hypothetical protein